MLLHLLKDEAEVRAIYRRAEFGDELSETYLENIATLRAIERDLIIAKLQKQDIPHDVIRIDQAYNIGYPQVYGPRVDQIMEDIGYEMYESGN